MRTYLNIDVLPINRHSGFDQPNHPGLHLAVPPRRTARGRAAELLVLFLEIQGNAPVSPKQQSQLLTGVAKTYYQHRGSVTAAMRTAAGKLNQYLMDRNLRNASSGLQSIALLTMVAIREKNVYLGQSGPTHAFVLSASESVHLYDIALAGRGLGVSRTTPIRFFQTDMTQGGLILISPAPPPTWTATTLKDSHRLRLENLHRHLIAQAGPDLTAILLKVIPGRGEMHLLQPVAGTSPPRAVPATDRGPAPDSAAPETAPAQPSSEPLSQPISETPAVIADAPPGEPPDAQPAVVPPPDTVAIPGLDDQSTELITQTAPPQLPVAHPEGPPMGRDPQSAVESMPAHASFRTPSVSKPPKPRHQRRFARTFGPAILAVGRALRVTWESMVVVSRTILGRLLPGEGSLALPSYVMFSIAVLIPVMVVTVASVVYFQRGLTAQHQVYLNQAALTAVENASLTDPNQLRDGWQNTLELLATAEAYKVSDESRALRTQALSELDQLDWVTRLNFQPALRTRLGENVRVSRLVATRDNLYLLNEETGVVLRAMLTGNGYELVPNFSCGPGTYGSFIIGPLIDIGALPEGNEFNASVLAMDGNGNLIYCIPGKPPISAPLVPPDSNWGQPVAFTVDSGNLYVLDPQTNAVWIYRGTDGLYSERPALFFSAQIPPLQDAVDLSVNRQDLYLVHNDGHLTTCTYSGLAESPTRCTDPATFVDTRPGREEGPVIANAQFIQIQYTPPPDPSIYLLDSTTRSIYHFSLRLTLQRQFRARDLPTQEVATAFAISPARVAFLAAGNEVFIASLP